MYANPCGTCERAGLGLWTAFIRGGAPLLGGSLDRGG